MSGELKLIDEAVAGSMQAFEDLISLYEKKIYNYCLRMTNRCEDAEDLTQEVFVRVYKSLDGFQRNSKLSTWIFRIAHNICIDHYRKAKAAVISFSQPLGPEDNREFELPSEDPTPEEEALRKEQQAFLLKSISELRPEYRTVIVLRDLQHRSYEEIAEILNVPLGTVKSHISRARAALREAVRPLLQGGDDGA